MKVATKFFGEIEINDKQVLSFKQGIPSFESNKTFVVLDIDEKGELKCLQSIEDKHICLLIISPWNYFKDYQIELSDGERIELEIKSHEDVTVYCVIAIRGEKITANLVAPIIINELKNCGKQIILSDTKYNIRQEIKCLY